MGDISTKVKKELKELIDQGERLVTSLAFGAYKERIGKLSHQASGKPLNKEEIDSIADIFKREYQMWYSSSLMAISQLMKDRQNDFVALYRNQRARRDLLSVLNYTIEDALRGLIHRNGRGENTVDASAAISLIEQQIGILKAAETRVDSTLMNITGILHAQLFDSEIGAAQELAKKGFLRAAGAVLGVVLESHLLEVCRNHKLALKKKKPTLNDLAEMLKEAGVVSIPI